MPHNWVKESHNRLDIWTCENCGSTIFKNDPEFVPSPDRLIKIKGDVKRGVPGAMTISTEITDQLTCDDYQIWKVSKS